MATVAYPGNLQTAQTGNADSTNVIQRSGGDANERPPVLRIVSTVGATPTVTVNIKGSGDGTTWWNIPYSPLASAPGDWVTSAIVITTATTGLYMLMPHRGWTFLKLVMTLNTNVTLTSDLL
jgi:hypothetical protein